MSHTKVKLFQNVVTVTPGIDLRSVFTLEKEMNEFLANDAVARVIDVKLSSSASPVGDRVAHYSLAALLIYEES